jgi:hypothetical protein
MTTNPGLNLRRVYEFRFREVDPAARRAVWSEIAAFMYRKMDSPRRVLDPAAGHCEFIHAIPAPERWAVDCKDHPDLHSPGVKAVVSDILVANLPSRHFDGVFVSNFLEHLTSQDQIAIVLAKLRDSMEFGGRIAVLGPNFRYCVREYFDCADHSLALTHVSVAEHLYAAGFEVTTVIPRFLPYSFRGSAVAKAYLRLLRKGSNSLSRSRRLITRFYLRSAPLWHIFGKQYLVMATLKELSDSRPIRKDLETARPAGGESQPRSPNETAEKRNFQDSELSRRSGASERLHN